MTVFSRYIFPPVCFEFDASLSSLDIGVQMLARPEKAYSYHSSFDQQMNEASQDFAYGHDLSCLSGHAWQASTRFPASTRSPSSSSTCAASRQPTPQRPTTSLPRAMCPSSVWAPSSASTAPSWSVSAS